MKFKVYVDYTLEEVSRPFYVGKGNLGRVTNLKRNDLHESIAQKYGIVRKIEFETDDETEALAKERELIAKYKTYVNHEPDHWGSNFTLGGDGTSGKHHSEETRKKIGDNQRGWHHTDEAKAKIAEASSRLSKGFKHSDEARKNMSEAHKGKEPWNKGKKFGKRKTPRVFSEEARKNISAGCKGRIPWNKGKKKHIIVEEELYTINSNV